MVEMPLANNAIVVGTQTVHIGRFLNFSYWARLSEVKQQISDMAMNGTSIRDSARVLKVSPTTVIETLKKSRSL